MKIDEDPKLFITELEGRILKMKNAKEDPYLVKHKAFKRDTLNKLPKSKEKGKMNPYEMEKKLIEAKLAATDGEKNTTVKVIERDLVKVYKAHYAKDEEETEEGERGYYVSGPRKTLTTRKWKRQV